MPLFLNNYATNKKQIRMMFLANIILIWAEKPGVKLIGERRPASPTPSLVTNYSNIRHTAARLTRLLIMPIWQFISLAGGDKPANVTDFATLAA